MPKAIDLTGQRFGRLTVVKFVGTDKHGSTLWKCKCDCESEVTVLANNLRRGHTTSCGCLKKEIVSEKLKKQNEILCKEGTMLNRLTAKKTKANTSGFRGITWNIRKQKWQARIGFKNKQIFLGYFYTLEDAAKARALAEEQYFQPILDKYNNSTHLKCDLLEG